MFTGLIQSVGKIHTLEPLSDDRGTRLSVDPAGWDHFPSVGDSIAVNGCCLTVAQDPACSGAMLLFDAIPETLARTTLGNRRPGDRVNLEHAVTASTLMGGHSVQGHVDAVAEVLSVDTSDGWRTRVALDPQHMPAVVPKGSVTVDGVSLTVAAVDTGANWFEVALIPVTLEATTLGATKPGDRVNIETDILARTVIHFMRNYQDPNQNR